ncbi:RNA polymerase sigma factor [Membranihabitans marinus]|uniref:RNA polymerase sigma factor n=1 Tax=Membranihabitans marinus TaxID=1227546 RepID=UPI001F1DC81E|nr:sigma-70 family RNA polymerase sigma factor [Membranihabitans marinus]
MKENHLISKIKDGNEDALTDIYTKYRNEFIQWGMQNHSLPEEDIKEVYQLSMLILYENIVQGKLKRINSSFKSYLFQIGKNKLYEYYRKNRSLAISPLDVYIYNIPANASNEEKDLKEKQINIVLQGLEQLGNPCAKILERFYFNKDSIQKIAKDFNYKNTETAKNQKYKCLNRLKKIIYQEFDKI